LPGDALLAARVEERCVRRLVTPRIDTPVGSARSELPLRLGRKAATPRLASLAGLIPVDAVDRVLRHARGIGDVAERIVDLALCCRDARPVVLLAGPAARA